ncbi:MAG: M20/M25/M40 family metallo-hydrolase [Mucinivorans sp.]
MFKILLSIILLFLSLHSFALPPIDRGMKIIDLKSAKAQVEFLSSDVLRGRLTGSSENLIAGLYLESLLKEMGYKTMVQEFEARGSHMQNILALLPGKDTTQVAVIGSHYDHLGVDSLGDVYNGADDNASGVAAIIQIAKAFKTSGVVPQQSLVFALWDGEENGLNGSRYFVKNFEKRTKIKSYLNFDMIGRNTDESRPQLFRYFYTKEQKQYATWLNEAIKKYNLKLEPDFRFLPDGGSDNASFSRAGVPTVWYHTDGHADFHQPSDTSDKINWDKMMDIIRSAYYLFWQMAN